MTDGSGDARVAGMEHAIPSEPMTVEEFERWLEDRPDETRYELADGAVVAMAPERVVHALLKTAAFNALRAAAKGMDCEAIPDGVAVRVEAKTLREPDAALRCGPRLPQGVSIYDDPVVLVEVLSPATAHTDLLNKVTEYGRLPTLAHYLIVDAQKRIVMHHRREGEGFFTTILPGGRLALDPPGITLDLDAILSEIDV